MWLGEYKLLYPKTQITVMVGDHMHAMTREAVDIAIRYGELTDSSLVCRRLHISERVLVAAPEYLKRFGLAEHALGSAGASLPGLADT